MDSRAMLSHAQVHEYDEHHHPHNLASQQVTHGVEEHHDDHEKKSVLKKVKAKAKKIKDTITKHGHHDHDHEHGHEYHYDHQNIPDDHDLDEEDDEDEDMVDHDPEIHGAPIYDSAGVRNATPGQVKSSGPGVNFGGTTVMGEEPHHEPRVVVVSPTTTEINQSRSTGPARTFVREEKAVQPKVNLERPMELEEDPHAPGSRLEAYAPANYQAKGTDPTGAGGAEIDVTPVQNSLARMNVHNEPKPIPEPKILPTVAETQYPSAAGSHHQFEPELSTATKAHYPSTESHDQNLTALSSGIKTQYPKSHDINLSHPSAKSHDQNLSEMSNTTKTQYPSAGSHDQFITEANPQYPSATSHDQYLPQDSTAIETQYPSSGRSHDQFTPEFSPQTKTGAINNNNTVEEQPQPLHESMENPSNQSNSYTDKISSATSAIADKAITAKNAVASATSAIADKTITAKNAVASKLGYGEKGDERYENETISGEKLSSQNQSSYTEKISSATSAIADKAATAKNTVATKLGFGEKGEGDSNVTSHEEEKKSQNDAAAAAAAAATSGSPTEYGKRIALSLTEKLAPVYGKVAGVGSAVKTKGSERESGVMEQDKGVSVKDYLAEKLRPGEEDKALSEVISGSLYKKGEDEEVYEEKGVDRDVRKVVSDAVHKRGEELDEGRVGDERRPMGKVTESDEVKRRLGSGDDEERENSPGTGVVDKLKGVVGSWFGKPEENQSSQQGGSGYLTGNSGEEVEQVHQAAGERRLQESTN